MMLRRGFEVRYQHMIFRTQHFQAGRIERSMYHIEHVIASGEATYKNNILKMTYLDIAGKRANMKGRHLQKWIYVRSSFDP
jgi:hypothetical protein